MGEAARRAFVTEQETFYYVTGFTRSQLWSAMRICGPEREGQRFCAYTDWAIDYVCVARAEGPKAPVLVDVRVMIHLPRWLSSRPAPSGLGEEWLELVEGLRAHELGHRDLAVAAGDRLHESLSSLAATLRAGELKGAAREELERTLREAREQEWQYDEDTRHGRIDPRIAAWASEGGEDCERYGQC